MAGSGSMGDWVPLMDYAMNRGVSLSTLRRYIKANKVKYRVENGRYLLLDEGIRSERHEFKESSSPAAYNAELQMRVQELEQELRSAHEEIAELKTLIALYEEQIPQSRLDC